MTTQTTRYIVDIVEHPAGDDVGERARWFWRALVLVDGKWTLCPDCRAVESPHTLCAAHLSDHRRGLARTMGSLKARRKADKKAKAATA